MNIIQDFWQICVDIRKVYESINSFYNMKELGKPKKQ